MGVSVSNDRTLETSCRSSDVFRGFPHGLILLLGPITKTEWASSSCYKTIRPSWDYTSKL